MSCDQISLRGTMLAEYASCAENSLGRIHEEAEAVERSVYQRDRDRIVHSRAFRKLKYKTQVFVYHEGDYYRTRLTHSLEVAQIARSISRSLFLNEDLAEALSLAHDFGHTPFGHAGENALHAKMNPYGGFDHNDQTLRILTRLEQSYADFDGLNLTWETLEGIAKHNGPVMGECSPTLFDLNELLDLQLKMYPSAEAQVASIADDIAYGAHDVDDGLRAGLFSIEQLSEISLVLPIIKEIQNLHKNLHSGRFTNEIIRRLINSMVSDLLKESRARLSEAKPRSSKDIRIHQGPLIDFSKGQRIKIDELKSFLFDQMYRHYKVNRMASKARRVVSQLFDLFMNEPNCLPKEWQVNEKLQDEISRARLVADYIAGMTDRYALLEHERLFDMSSMN